MQRRQAAEQAASQLREQREQLRAQLEATEAAHRDELVTAWQGAEQARQDAQQARQAQQEAQSVAWDTAAAALAGSHSASEAQVPNGGVDLTRDLRTILSGSSD